MRVTSRPPLPVQIDGELVGNTPVVVEVLPDRVEILVPREAEED